MRKLLILIPAAIIAVFVFTPINDKINSAITETTGVDIAKYTTWKTSSAKNCIKVPVNGFDPDVKLAIHNANSDPLNTGICAEAEKVSYQSSTQSNKGYSNYPYDDFNRIMWVDKNYGDIFTGNISEGESGWMDGYKVFQVLGPESEREKQFVFISTTLQNQKTPGSNNEIKVKRKGNILEVIDEPEGEVGVYMTQIRLPPYYTILNKENYLILKWPPIKKRK